METSKVMIIGTSHISKQSVKQINEAYGQIEPDIIAVELDKQRYYSLLHNKREHVRIRDIRKIGIKGYLFLLFGAWAEKKLGDIVGMKPGVDMLNAIKLAQKNKKLIAFIDQDIQITIKKISKRLTWKEKWNFLVDLVKGFVFRKQEVKFDLTKVPDDELISKMIETIKPRYPNIYEVLIKERDEVMTNNIMKILKLNPGKNILAVIGAGHKKRVVHLLTKYKHPDKTQNQYDVSSY